MLYIYIYIYIYTTKYIVTTRSGWLNMEKELISIMTTTMEWSNSRAMTYDIHITFQK